MADAKPTFGLVHGSWHGSWCWEPLQNELKDRGYESIAIDLPIDDPTASFDTYALTVSEAIQDNRNVVLVGHSRAGNVIPRVAGHTAVRQLIFLCASFEPATVYPLIPQGDTQQPPRNSELFRRGVIEDGQSMTVYDEKLAKKLFYTDCPEEIQDWAVSRLRPQRRSPHEPSLQSWPAIPQDYIYCEEDRVVLPSWSKYVATNWLGIEPISFPGGHSPFLSRPRELAQLLIKLSQ